MTTESAGPDAGPLTDAELDHLRWLAGAHPAFRRAGRVVGEIDRLRAALAEYERDADWAGLARPDMEALAEAVCLGTGGRSVALPRMLAARTYQALTESARAVGRWRSEAVRVNAALTAAHEADIARLRAEADGLRAALAEIRDRCGVVCPEFEICHHPSCQSSVTAWMIADEALGPSPAPEADPGF